MKINTFLPYFLHIFPLCVKNKGLLFLMFTTVAVIGCSFYILMNGNKDA